MDRPFTVDDPRFAPYVDQLTAMRWFHGSVVDLPVDIVLTGVHRANFAESGPLVSITTVVSNAQMWAQKAARGHGLDPAAAASSRSNRAAGWRCGAA